MLLQLENITKKFQHPSRAEEITVLEDLSWEIAAGETIAVTGPSGSGKSTLLNIMGGLDRPSLGVVRFQGKNLAELGDLELSRLRNRAIGFVFQLHYLLPQCTVLENVLVPTIPYDSGQGSQDAQDRAARLLNRVGLEEHWEHFPAQLSGGELQRVAVVRALINQPRLVLADEPTGSLDRESSAGLAELLIRLNKEEDTTLIVVTHSLELAGLLDKAFIIKNRTLEELGRP